MVLMFIVVVVRLVRRFRHPVEIGAHDVTQNLLNSAAHAYRRWASE